MENTIDDGIAVPQAGEWHVYILQCCDDTLYTGIARDLEARIAVHNDGKGAKYTRSRRPLVLVYTESANGRGAAQRREYAIRRLKLGEKRALIRSRHSEQP
ncbi:MAG: GIY-YIG nuclease family protein [Gammaproteobacteria bacterium]|nr:GIY-YIG nuclease family protein [Gammaproteobacteria bacterium]MBU1653789.1 GIY-YIG nuclease family protein [Gammaproteobacteria bacterium]MBU1961701.1 GIY-YIG nuclease family protein [Gammaproteobacteria bacterium]